MKTTVVLKKSGSKINVYKNGNMIGQFVYESNLENIFSFDTEIDENEFFNFMFKN